MQVKIQDKYSPKNHFIQDKEYHLLTIEDDYVRVVDNTLDNYLKPISDYSHINLQDCPNDLFDNEPYFGDRLHDGDHQSSLIYADKYMAYLFHYLNIDVANILYQNYLKTLQGELGLICYWQKQWLKYVFNINVTQELRKFNEKQWIIIINHHVNSIKI